MTKPFVKSQQQLREDEILRRMIATPPTPHKPLGKRKKPKAEKPVDPPLKKSG